MSYRDDLDALAARHAALVAEVAQKQRELAELTRLLAEARQVDQAEAHFERAPARKRRVQRGVLAGALAAVFASGLGLGYAAEADPGAPRAGATLQVRDLTERLSAAFARADRRQAAYEALRQLGLTAKEDRAARTRARKAGVSLEYGQHFVTEELRSLAHEDQR